METISSDDELYRRLAPRHVNPDGTVNSAAYKVNGKPDPSISVDLARLTSAEESLARPGRPGFGLGTITAGVPTSLGLTVRPDPLPDNAAHTLIEGNTQKATCRRLAEATRVTVPPNPPGDEAP